MDRPTLLSSPRSQADFAARLLYFALAPHGIVACAALFPVYGALFSVAVALLVFVLGETAQGWARSSWLLRKVLERELRFQAYYVAHPPRAFAYYVFYPLLFPYWLLNREARREFWLFKGYTITGVAILLAVFAYQYLAHWWPELGLRSYLPVVGMALGMELLLVLAALMPIATTVIAFHQSGRRRRLILLLLVGLASSGLSVARLARRRDPIVSYSTRERVRLRTARHPQRAHAVQLEALKAALADVKDRPTEIEGDGKVEGSPADRAHRALEQYYQHDEAFAFDLWASPRFKPKVLVLYFEAGSGQRPLWVAVYRHGTEITDWKLLPRGASLAMKHAAEE